MGRGRASTITPAPSIARPSPRAVSPSTEYRCQPMNTRGSDDGQRTSVVNEEPQRKPDGGYLCATCLVGFRRCDGNWLACDPLTRPAPADKSAGCAPPSPPRGRGLEINSPLPSPPWGRGAGSEGVHWKPFTLSEQHWG